MSFLTDIIARLKEQPRVLELSDEEVNALSSEEIEMLQDEYGAGTFLKLPPSEQNFMEWLQEEDPEVWEDLWEGDSEQLVSLAHLGLLQKGGPGFRICELSAVDNFFFTPRHVRPEGVAAAKGILKKAEAGQELAVGEALLLEIISAPVDIWHFCWKYGVPLSRGKDEAQQLAAHQWIVHLKRSEELASYIEE